MSLETAIIIATALLCTLPVGWWVSRSARASDASGSAPRTLSREERQSLITELRVAVVRGDARASEAERVMRTSTMRELRREGLGPADVDKLSEVAIQSLWLCRRIACGSDSDAAAAMATLPPEARASWIKVRSKIRRERDSESRRVAEREWIDAHRDEYDRLTLVASGGKAIVQWLGEQGPTAWHAVGTALSPDQVGYGPWLWLSEQPSLDRATAISLFLKSEPQKALRWKPDDVTGARREQLTVLSRLGRRLARDDFTQRSFACPAPSRQAYFKVQDEVHGADGSLPWPKLPRHALGPVEGADARTAFVVDGAKVRKRVDLSPYVAGQRRA